MPKADRIVETVETWGIRPYYPELDSRPKSDPGRRRDEERYARNCLSTECRECRINPIAELAGDRDGSTGVVDSTDRVRLFASAWADYRAWKEVDDPVTPPGALTLLGETEEGAQKHAMACLMMVGMAIPALWPWRRKTRGSARARVPRRGR